MSIYSAADYYRRGLAYGQQGDNASAIAEFDQAIRLNDPDYNAKAYYMRGVAYAQQGDSNRAIADFSQSLTFDDSDYNAKAYYLRGSEYLNNGDSNRAIADLSQAIMLDSNNAAAYHDRAIAYLDEGDYDSAKADFDQSIRLDPEDAATYCNRGVLYMKKGDYDLAIADCEAALRIKPNNAKAKKILEAVRQKQYENKEYHEEQVQEESCDSYKEQVQEEPKEPEEQVRERKYKHRQQKGLCGYCGGQIGGIFSKKCKFCKQPRVEWSCALKDKVIGRPQINSIVPFGNYNWRVLDVQNDKVLILSDKIIGVMPYHRVEKDITWEKCSLRKYLNGTFYRTFKSNDRARVVETRVKNYNSPWYGIRGGSDTTDRIFLLSTYEVIKYFGDSGRLKKGERNNESWVSDRYDYERVAYIAKDTKKGWWLRSPGNRNFSAAFVSDLGWIQLTGYTVNCYDNGNCGGVRPALWLEL